jgi:hypothetical protein
MLFGGLTGMLMGEGGWTKMATAEDREPRSP